MQQGNQKSFIIIITTIITMFIGIVYIDYQYVHHYNNKVFGVTYMTMNNPFYEVIHNELVKSIEAKGDKIIALDPALDIDKQSQQIYSFIDQRVDGIFINPIDSEKLKPALQAAKDANIPTIIFDAPVISQELVNCTIVSHNYDAGVQCANDMMSKLKSANIVLLKHTAVKSAKDRIEGFIDTIKAFPQYKIVSEGECEGQLELAMPLMEKLLSETKNIDVVMALNDPSALGALAALESKNRTDVIVYGVDGTPDLKSLINKSSMVAGTVAQSPITIGQTSAVQMYNILDGKSVEKEIIVPVFLINKENVNLYDEKGWQ